MTSFRRQSAVQLWRQVSLTPRPNNEKRLRSTSPLTCARRWSLGASTPSTPTLATSALENPKSAGRRGRNRWSGADYRSQGCSPETPTVRVACVRGTPMLHKRPADRVIALMRITTRVRESRPSTEPSPGEIRDGKLYGRRAYDMKAFGRGHDRPRRWRTPDALCRKRLGRRRGR